MGQLVTQRKESDGLLTLGAPVSRCSLCATAYSDPFDAARCCTRTCGRCKQLIDFDDYAHYFDACPNAVVSQDSAPPS